QIACRRYVRQRVFPVGRTVSRRGVRGTPLTIRWWGVGGAPLPVGWRRVGAASPVGRGSVGGAARARATGRDRRRSLLRRRGVRTGMLRARGLRSGFLRIGRNRNPSGAVPLPTALATVPA